jgi:hypothetical protein
LHIWVFGKKSWSGMIGPIFIESCWNDFMRTSKNEQFWLKVYNNLVLFKFNLKFGPWLRSLGTFKRFETLDNKHWETEIPYTIIKEKDVWIHQKSLEAYFEVNKKVSEPGCFLGII